MTSRKNQTGFTLIEMLVVLVIIGLLVGLVGPKLFSRVETSKVQTAQAQIKMLKGALQTLYLDIGRFPNDQEGLGLLEHPPASPREKSSWRGPYLDEKVPPDPWGRPYVYLSHGPKDQPFALFSYGADGKPGGTGNDADIGILPPP